MVYQRNGVVYEKAIGSRREVFSGKAHRTSGGLTRDKLMRNKRGRIVSKKKSMAAKKRTK